MIDGVEITGEEKVKAENLHGYDYQDREIIFKSLLPDEKYVDRRISKIEDVPGEIDSDGDVQISIPQSKGATSEAATP